MIMPAARPCASWFEGIGCDTIGDLRRLPRPGLQRRYGRALIDFLDSAFGSLPEVFEWVEAPTKFDARMELFDRIENVDLLLAGAQRLVLQLIGWLCAMQLAVKGIMLRLEHERGRVARAPTEVEILLGEPVWHSDHIVRLLKERLGKLVLDAPVIGLVLHTTQLQPMEPPTESLFPEPGGTEEDQVRMIELLVARLGEDKVRQVKPVADHRPEVANRWVSIQEKVRQAVITDQLPPNLSGILRPTWLLVNPIPLLMRNHRPFYGSPLRMVSGPERVEAGWWGIWRPEITGLRKVRNMPCTGSIGSGLPRPAKTRNRAGFSMGCLDSACSRTCSLSPEMVPVDKSLLQLQNATAPVRTITPMTMPTIKAGYGIL